MVSSSRSQRLRSYILSVWERWLSDNPGSLKDHKNIPPQVIVGSWLSDVQKLKSMENILNSSNAAVPIEGNAPISLLALALIPKLSDISFNAPPGFSIQGQIGKRLYFLDNKQGNTVFVGNIETRKLMPYCSTEWAKTAAARAILLVSRIDQELGDNTSGEQYAQTAIHGAEIACRAIEQRQGCPSQITEQPWLFTQRRIGAYPPIGDNSGKWLIFCEREQIDELWQTIKQATEEGLLGNSTKASTAFPSPLSSNSNRHVMCVYTYDWTDEADVRQIRTALRALGITRPIAYKTNKDTKDGLYRSSTSGRISKYYE